MLLLNVCSQPNSNGNCLRAGHKRGTICMCLPMSSRLGKLPLRRPSSSLISAEAICWRPFRDRYCQWQKVRTKKAIASADLLPAPTAKLVLVIDGSDKVAICYAGDNLLFGNGMCIFLRRNTHRFAHIYRTAHLSLSLSLSLPYSRSLYRQTVCEMERRHRCQSR